MIVVISSQQDNIDSSVNERFGRSPYLIRVDTETMAWQALENPGIQQAHGAGVSTAQLVIDQKANVALSGDFGPNAASALSAAGVAMRTFKNKDVTVKQALAELDLIA